MIDVYRTLSHPSSAKLTRKRSRFLADGIPVDSMEDVVEALAVIRRRYHDASHHCSAYRLLVGDSITARSDDDGEPAGSAGLPILQQLEAAEMLNVLLVVTRYFGGAKLGMGGLVRAYGDVAKLAMDSAVTIRRAVHVEVSIEFPIEVNSSVMGTIHRHRAKVLQIGFVERGQARVHLAPSAVDAFCRELVEATGDRVELEVGR